MGDAAYPTLPWIAKPYPGINLTPAQLHFNFVHASARMAIEQSFGLLKCRFRILGKRQDTDINNVHFVIYACFILHNICIDGSDHNELDWDSNNEINMMDEISDDYNINREHIREYVINPINII